MSALLATLGVSGAGGVPADPGAPSDYWKVDSWTTTLAPSVGAVSLNVVGTPGSVAGKIGNGASCSGSDGFSSSNALFNLGDTNFTWRLWFRLVSSSGIFLDTKATDPPNGYRIQADTTNGPAFYCTSGGTSTTVTFGSGFSSGTWVMVVAAHDATNNLIKVSLNGAAFVTAAHSVGIGALANPFTLGNLNFVGDTSVDELGLWTGKAFSDGEALYEWNGGAGRTY